MQETKRARNFCYGRESSFMCKNRFLQRLQHYVTKVINKLLLRPLSREYQERFLRRLLKAGREMPSKRAARVWF